MAITYTPGSGLPLDRIRFLIGDTDVQAQEAMRLEDGEIADAIAMYGDLHTSAAACADALAAKFARKAEGSAGPQRIAPMSRAAELRVTAARLRARSADTAQAFAGGITGGVSNPAAFKRGQFDHPEAT